MVTWLLYLLVIVQVVKTQNSENVLRCNQDFFGSVDLREIIDTDVDIMMTPHEKILFWRYLQTSRHYFEYGSGGSTLLACKTKTLSRIYSVESDVRFLDHLIGNSSCLQTALISERVKPLIIDIGPIGAFGNPIDNSSIHLWPRYSEAILSTDVEVLPDLVLVDGRFRVASALQSLRRVGREGVVLIHDFFNRPLYYEVLKYVDVIDCVGNLIVLKIKTSENINWKEFDETIENFKYIKD